MRTNRILPVEAPINLDRVRWKGEDYFRVLSMYFSVRWNFPEAEEMVRRTLGHFVVEHDPDEYPYYTMPGMPPQYSIVRRRSPRGTYHVLVEDRAIATNKSLGYVIGQLLWHVNGHSLRRSGDYLIFHAGAVSTPQGDGLLLPAASGSGKTTLTAGLVRAGFGYLSDEAGCVDPVSRILYPYPRALSFKYGLNAVFPDLYEHDNGWDDPSGARHVSPAEMGLAAIGRPCPIRYIVAPKYQPDARTEVTPISHAEGAMELLQHSFNLVVYGHRALPAVVDIARRARSYRLVTGSLDDAVEAVIRLTTRGRRAPNRAA